MNIEGDDGATRVFHSQESLDKAKICSYFVMGFLESLQTLTKLKICVLQNFLIGTSEGR